MPADRAGHVSGTARLPKNVRDPVDSIYNRAGKPHGGRISQERRENVRDFMGEDRVQECLLGCRVTANPAIVPEVEPNEARVDSPSIPFNTADAQPGLSERQPRVVIRNLDPGEEACRIDGTCQVIRRGKHLFAQPRRVHLQETCLTNRNAALASVRRIYAL